MPVLVLGGIVGSQIPLFVEHDLSLTASSVDKLRAIDECAAALGRTARVHLKIDTGMERIGVHWYHAERLLEASLGARHVDAEGVFTHLANADEPDLTHAKLQLERFAEVLRFYERRSLPTPRTSRPRACSSSASSWCCASTSGARCRCPRATSPTPQPCCACPRRTAIRLLPRFYLAAVRLAHKEETDGKGAES